ncbi:MAG: S-layer protein [Chitinophagaceae bacterium]|jgi:hypothetical protein|nr:S-layer protein [Chitinophagaceae bacterium]
MRRYSLFLLLLLLSFTGVAQDLTDEESKLYKLIMNYRKEKGLPEIPLSKSLTTVAKAHTKDLKANYTFGSDCNLHSWSPKGTWTPCCYTDDHAQAKNMWNKPGELTSYKGNGYEIAHGGKDYKATAQTAFEAWKSSKGHNAVILNEDIWKKEWKAIGISIEGGFAMVWFGNETDEPAK